MRVAVFNTGGQSTEYGQCCADTPDGTTCNEACPTVTPTGGNTGLASNTSYWPYTQSRLWKNRKVWMDFYNNAMGGTGLPEEWCGDDGQGNVAGPDDTLIRIEPLTFVASNQFGRFRIGGGNDSDGLLLAVGSRFRVHNSTGNDGYYTVQSTFDGGSYTDIYTEESIADASSEPDVFLTQGFDPYGLINGPPIWPGKETRQTVGEAMNEVAASRHSYDEIWCFVGGTCNSSSAESSAAIYQQALANVVDWLLSPDRPVRVDRIFIGMSPHTKNNEAAANRYRTHLEPATLQVIEDRASTGRVFRGPFLWRLLGQYPNIPLQRNSSNHLTHEIREQAGEAWAEYVEQVI